MHLLKGKWSAFLKLVLAFLEDNKCVEFMLKSQLPGVIVRNSLTVAFNDYLTILTDSNGYRFNSPKCSLVLVLFSWFSCHSSPGILHFFLQRVSLPNVLSFKCMLLIPEASPTIILKENYWWIEWQTVASINVCFTVFRNAGAGGIYLINGCSNPSIKSLLLPSCCSIWSLRKHSALWS